MLQHAETLLPMAGDKQAELNCHTAGSATFFFRPTPLGFRQVVQHVQLHVA